MKKIKAVQPYIHPGHLNFKLPAYEAWVKNGGETLPPRYPCRAMHGAAYRMELPSLWKSKDTAVLMFVEPVSITFDTFPYYATHEIIPFIWDCWPRYYDKMEKWLRKHKVRTAIFTSSMELEAMKRRVPEINYINCPEAVDTSLYKPGKQLKDRNIDLLEFGRSNERILGNDFSPMGGDKGYFNHVCTKVGDKFIYTNEQLYNAMGDAKITICLPKSMTHPDIAEGVETLTQRYWEAMLSRMIIIGHCPKELEELIEYNPVIEIPFNNTKEEKTTNKLVFEILEKIDDYQNFVDKNRDIALKKGNWKYRMKGIKQELNSLGYRI